MDYLLLNNDDLIEHRRANLLRIIQIERGVERHSLEGQKELRQRRAAERKIRTEVERRFKQLRLF